MTEWPEVTDPQTAGPLGAPYLGVDVQPDVLAGAFTLGVSELGGTDVLGGSEELSRWVNVVCDVTRVSSRRGATTLAGALTRAEAGAATVTVTDYAGQLDPLQNGDAVHRGTPFRLRAWGYEDALVPQAVRTNRIPNPRGRVDLTGWLAQHGTGGAGTFTQLATGGPDGGPAMRMTWTTGNTSAAGTSANVTLRAEGRATDPLPILVVAGSQYTSSVYVRSSVAQRVDLRIFWFTATASVSTVASTPVVLAPNTWTRVSASAVAPATAAYCLTGVFTPSGTDAVPFPAGATLDATMALLERTTTIPPGDYFDGNTPDEPQTTEGAKSYAWGGTADASVSEQSELWWTSVPWESVLFTGKVDELHAAYLPGEPTQVTVSASDLIAELAAWEAEGRAADGVGAGDNLLSRTQRVLDEADLGEIDLTRSDVSYVATLLPSKLQQGWQPIVDAADAELGRVWVDVHNRLVIRGRRTWLAGTVQGTLSDVHGDATETPHCCMAGADVVHGTELVNRVVASRRALSGEDQSILTVVRRDDLYSQARYGLAAIDRTAQLEVENVTQVTDWADAVLEKAGAPGLRVDSVTPSPTEDDLTEALEQWRAVVGTDIGDRWRFRFHPEGLEVDQTVEVQGVQLDLTPDGWSVTWTTTRSADRVRPRPVPGAPIMAPATRQPATVER